MTRRPWVRVGLLIGAYLLVFAGQTWLTRQVFTQRFPGANDFYPRWAGGCALFWHGASPYDEATTRRIQEGIYGRPALPTEDQVAYAYPLHTLWLTWPACFSRDFAVVQAAWMTLLIHATLAGTALARRAAGWRATKAVWLTTLVWSVFVYPNMRAILLGQLSLLVFVVLMASLVLIKLGRPGWAGAALALATVKPQMAFLGVGWLLWWAWHAGRRRLLASFGLTLAGLVAGVTLLDPAWPAGFLTQLQRYPSYTELGSGIWIMTTYYLGSPPAFEWALTLAALAGLAIAWWRLRAATYGWMLWVTSLTLLATHFVAPRTATTHFAVFLLPLFLLFEHWRQRRWGRAAVWLTLGVGLVGGWALFLATVSGVQENALNYLPIPLLLLAAILWQPARLVAAPQAGMAS